MEVGEEVADEVEGPDDDGAGDWCGEDVGRAGTDKMAELTERDEPAASHSGAAAYSTGLMAGRDSRSRDGKSP